MQQGGRQATNLLDTLLPGVLSNDPILGQGGLDRVRLLFLCTLSSLRRGGAMMSHIKRGAGVGVALGLWLVCSTFRLSAKSSED